MEQCWGRPSFGCGSKEDRNGCGAMWCCEFMTSGRLGERVFSHGISSA